MNPSTIGLSHLYAKARHADFIADAERDRIAASAASAASGREGRQAVIALRMRIGAVLIRIGERLHGAIDERCGEVGALRPARS